MAERLQQRWGKPVIIENRPGGDGLVAISAFMSANDDHVLMYASTGSFTVHPFQYDKLPYDFKADMLPIAQVTNTILAIGVPAESKITSLKEMVAQMKAAPGKFNVALVPGITELVFDGFVKKEDVSVTKVPYRNIVEGVNDLSVGRLQMMMAAFTNMETVHIDAYALLLKTLGMPKTEFEAFRDYAEMRAKADYMHEFGVETVADVSRTLAMFGAFTEGMALFASFAMLLNFPRHNKMSGMGQIVTWSVRDESLHCEGIIKLFHEWNRETGALTPAVRDDIVDVAKTMVGLEENFVELAFGLGDIEGMTPDDIRAYVRYVADWRLTQLRLPATFGYFEQTEGGYNQLKPHPLPWLVEILNGVEHANFFEQRATEYSKGASRGTWDGDSGVWAQFDTVAGR